MRRIAISWLILCAALCALLQMQTPAAAQCDMMMGVFNCRTPASGGGPTCSPPLLSCVTVPSGLVFWMPFDTSTTSGTTTNDITANANNGALTGSPTIGTGQIQQAVYVNGTSQYVKITSGTPWSNYTTSPLQNTPFSVSAWVYRTSDTGSVMDIASLGYNGSYTKWEIGINTSTLTAVFDSYNGSANVGVLASTATSTANTWEFWVATWDGVSAWQVIKNAGTASTASSTAGPTGINSEPLDIGALDNSGTAQSFFPGRIDDVRIYSRVLSGTDITNIYNAGVLGKP